MLTAKLGGTKEVLKWLERGRKKSVKDLNTAIRVEAFELRKALQEEIRQGSPGGRAFRPLSYLARGLRRSRKGPLYKLAASVRYHVTSKDPFIVRVGWVGPGVSRSWKGLAKVLQEGFDREISPRQRRFFIRAGATRKRFRKYFFIKEGTRKMKTPARPILSPFWRVRKEKTWRNIRRNFIRKSAGERI